MTISKAVKSDAKALFKIEQDVFNNDSMALSLSSFYYHLEKNIIYKIEVEGNLAGYILWLERKKFLRLYSLAVLKQFRGLGLASKILEFSLEKLTEKPMSLEVRKSNDKAISLYEKFGFEKVKELKEYYEDEDGVLMRLER